MFSHAVLILKKCVAAAFLLCSFTIHAQLVKRGPYLQNASHTGVVIRWRTDVATTSKVTLGNVFGNYPIVVTDNNNTTEHIVKVNGLTPDTRYYYTIGTNAIQLQGGSSNFFETAPTDTTKRKITVAAFGDCGRNENNYQVNSRDQYLNYIHGKGMQAADLMLLIGDNAYQNGVDSEYRDNFFSAYQSTVLKNHVLFPAPGNHEYANDINRQKDHAIDYFNIFSVPDSGQCGGVPSYSKAYYSFDWGNIHFMSFDSYGMEDAGTTRMYDTNGKQVQWIKADLAANTKKWTIAYWHHPPYTMGNHNSDNETELVRIRQNFIRILERNGVDMVLCGHSHLYERSHLMKGYYGNEAAFSKAVHTVDSSSGKYDGSTSSCPYVYSSASKDHGTVYVVSGSSGAGGGIQSGFPHNAMPFSIHDGGMFYFEIEDNRLDAKFIRQDGVIADQFTIMKDARKTETISLSKPGKIKLSASWEGTYRWNTAYAGRDTIVDIAKTTTYVIKDNENNTCLTDTITVAINAGSRIYPVPSQNLLTVEIVPTKNDIYTFSVYSVTGSLLKTTSIALHSGWQQLSLSLDGISGGQELFLKITGSDFKETLRFVKQ